jgi:hypothetical protein
MARTIVTIEERNGILTARLAKAGAAYANARTPVALGCSHAALPPLDTPPNVRAYGDALRNALMQHPAISLALQQIFSHPRSFRRCSASRSTPRRAS